MFALLLALAGPAPAGAAEPPAKPPALITHPDWLRKPTDGEVAGYWPAGSHSKGGRVEIGCIVTLRGLLGQCKVLSETPTGQGFGASALMVAHLFEMRPLSVDGVPVSGGYVNIPIRFGASDSAIVDQSPMVRVAGNLPWRQTPSAADLAAAFPSQAIGKAAYGRVMLRCRVMSDGSMWDCDNVSEAPAGEGFAKAAHGLVKEFKADPNSALIKASEELYVTIAFDFRDPRQPGPPIEVVDPEWLQTPDPRMAGKLFPVEAAKAGLTTGVAVVDCGLTRDGRMTDCRVASETPADLGFGAAALKLAGVLVMNPWTRQGDPVEGARVRMPIRINLAAGSPKPADAHSP